MTWSTPIFCGKKKEILLPVCYLLNLPREWYHYELYMYIYYFFQNKQYVSVYVDNSSAYNIMVLQDSDFTGILLGI